MRNAVSENIEIDLLVEAIFKRYGYDFRNYARASLKRRIKLFLDQTEYHRILEMLPALLDDESFFRSLLKKLSIPVTEMFRDPLVYKAIRKEVVPILKTYPFIKIWHAGCATGEEVYSLAILLKEEGLYDRAQIYATDINDDVLERAREGIYAVKDIKRYTTNYQKSGGKEFFAKYYHSQYESVIMNRDLKENIIFANHNLVIDSVFGDMHLIMCRNVMIYFDKILQNRVLKLFYNSLIHHGFLCLGSKESLLFTDVQNAFRDISKAEKIYQKKIDKDIRVEAEYGTSKS